MSFNKAAMPCSTIQQFCVCFRSFPCRVKSWWRYQGAPQSFATKSFFICTRQDGLILWRILRWCDPFVEETCKKRWLEHSSRYKAHQQTQSRQTKKKMTVNRKPVCAQGGSLVPLVRYEKSEWGCTRAYQLQEQQRKRKQSKKKGGMLFTKIFHRIALFVVLPIVRRMHVCARGS